MDKFTLGAAGIWVLALVFVVVSLLLRFGVKLRVFAGLVVGSGLSAAASEWIIDVTIKASERIAKGIDGLSAYEAAALAAALPTIIAILAGFIVYRFFRGKGGGRSHGGGFGHRSSGAGGAAGIPPSVALAAAIILPVLVPGIGGAINGAFA
jgi:hypothetical protein